MFHIWFKLFTENIPGIPRYKQIVQVFYKKYNRACFICCVSWKIWHMTYMLNVGCSYFYQLWPGVSSNNQIYYVIQLQKCNTSCFTQNNKLVLYKEHIQTEIVHNWTMQLCGSSSISNIQTHRTGHTDWEHLALSWLVCPIFKWIMG